MNKQHSLISILSIVLSAIIMVSLGCTAGCTVASTSSTVSSTSSYATAATSYSTTSSAYNAAASRIQSGRSAGIVPNIVYTSFQSATAEVRAADVKVYAALQAWYAAGAGNGAKPADFDVLFANLAIAQQKVIDIAKGVN